MSALRLSRNELSSLLKTAFQGLFRHSQDWGALAEGVLWLEMHGHGGVMMMVEALEAGCLKPFSGDVEETADGYAFGFKGGSVVMGVPAIADMARARLKTHGCCRIQVREAEHVGALAAAAGWIGQARVEGGELVCDRKSGDGSAGENGPLYQLALQEGVIMCRSHYDTLTKLAARVLVEATEASRRGAGQGA